MSHIYTCFQKWSMYPRTKTGLEPSSTEMTWSTITVWKMSSYSWQIDSDWRHPSWSTNSLNWMESRFFAKSTVYSQFIPLTSWSQRPLVITSSHYRAAKLPYYYLTLGLVCYTAPHHLDAFRNYVEMARRLWSLSLFYEFAWRYKKLAVHNQWQNLFLLDMHQRLFGWSEICGVYA